MKTTFWRLMLDLDLDMRHISNNYVANLIDKLVKHKSIEIVDHTSHVAL